MQYQDDILTKIVRLSLHDPVHMSVQLDIDESYNLHERPPSQDGPLLLNASINLRCKIKLQNLGGFWRKFEYLDLLNLKFGILKDLKF